MRTRALQRNAGDTDLFHQRVAAGWNPGSTVRQADRQPGVRAHNGKPLSHPKSPRSVALILFGRHFAGMQGILQRRGGYLWFQFRGLLGVLTSGGGSTGAFGVL